jgi:hypothetical protein
LRRSLVGRASKRSRWPRARSARATAEPTKPVAPVTSVIMGAGVSVRNSVVQLLCGVDEARGHRLVAKPAPTAAARLRPCTRQPSAGRRRGRAPSFPDRAERPLKQHLDGDCVNALGPASSQRRLTPAASGVSVGARTRLASASAFPSTRPAVPNRGQAVFPGPAPATRTPTATAGAVPRASVMEHNHLGSIRHRPRRRAGPRSRPFHGRELRLPAR